MIIDKNKIYYLDGATGTEIHRRGFPTKLPLWSASVLFEKPELVKDIYLDYIKSGADIITTNTFRTQRRTLNKAGLSADTERVNHLAVELAIQARKEANAKRPIYIAGCITTLEDCYRPDLIPSVPELKKEHGEQIKLLASTPIDFFLLETFNSIREAEIAAQAVSKSGKQFMVSFVVNKNGDILNGDTWEDAVKRLSKFRPLAILVNCVPIPIATKALEKISKLTNLPIGAYANGSGKADNDDGWNWKINEADEIDEYSKTCADWINLGTTIVGGCCGTNHNYTLAYSKLKKTNKGGR